jgi:predicted dehydrogenase
MLKIGVLGAGHLGKIHLKNIKEIKEFELVGFFDLNLALAKEIANEYQIQAFSSFEEMLENVDVVDIVTPTTTHFEYAEKCLKKSIHIFIEKPLTHTLEEAKILLNLSHEANVKIQVGHVERFNPAYKVAFPIITHPMFIEAHRLAQFNPRGTDVSVVLDLMIHDIDIVLSMVKSSIKKISASGVAVVSDTPDIANARIEFDNGCVANLTASRISMKNMRKTRVFQRNAYISIDFLEKKTEIIQLSDVKNEPDPLDIIIELGEGKKPKKLKFEQPEILTSNAIFDELTAFAQSIIQDKPTTVSIDDGYNAMLVANQIIEKLKVNVNMLEY